MNVHLVPIRAAFVSMVAAAGFVIGGQEVAPAQGAAPVRVQNCSIVQYQPPTPAFRRYYWYDYGFAGPVVPQGSPYTDGITISFVNTSAQVADRVVFGVNYRGDFERVVDAGTFSPNVTINHTFADVFSGYAYLGTKPNSCTVRVVRFKDGSTWHAQGMGLRRQATTP